MNVIYNVSSSSAQNLTVEYCLYLLIADYIVYNNPTEMHKLV